MKREKLKKQKNRNNSLREEIQKTFSAVRAAEAEIVALVSEPWCYSPKPGMCTLTCVHDQVVFL